VGIGQHGRQHFHLNRPDSMLLSGSAAYEACYSEEYR